MGCEHKGARDIVHWLGCGGARGDIPNTSVYQGEWFIVFKILSRERGGEGGGDSVIVLLSVRCHLPEIQMRRKELLLFLEGA